MTSEISVSSSLTWGVLAATLCVATSLACGGTVVGGDGGPDGGPDGADATFDGDGALDVTDSGGDAATPSVIAADVGHAQSIAVDDLRLYWANATAGTISSCLKTSCSAPFATIAFNQTGADHLIVNNQEIYWTTSDGNVARCGTTENCGPDPTILSTVQYNISALAVASGQAYWNTLHALVTCSVANCAGTQATIFSGAIQPLNLAVDATTIFWSDLGGGSNKYEVLACPLSGCTSPITLAAALPAVDTIALTSTDVYWVMNSGTQGLLVHCAKSGCGGNPATAGVSQPVGAPAFLVDTGNAYWATTDIVRCTGLSCAGGAQPLAKGQVPLTLVADDTSLYWPDLNNGSIYALGQK